MANDLTKFVSAADWIMDEQDRLQDRARQLLREIQSQARMAPEVLNFKPNAVFMSAEQAYQLSFLNGTVPERICGLDVIIVNDGDQLPRVTRREARGLLRERQSSGQRPDISTNYQTEAASHPPAAGWTREKLMATKRVKARHGRLSKADLALVRRVIIERVEQKLPEDAHNEVQDWVYDLAIQTTAELLELRGDIAMTMPTHRDDTAVMKFAEAMRQKMAEKRAEGKGGWQTAPMSRLALMLVEHIDKGDPLDIANFSMMLWHNGPAAGAEIAKQMASVRSQERQETINRLAMHFGDLVR